MANTRRKKTCYSNNSQKKNCTGKFFSYHRNRTYKAKIEKDFILFFFIKLAKAAGISDDTTAHGMGLCIKKYLQVTVFIFEV